MARSAYCNATTDLKDIDPNINQLQELIPIVGWTAYSSTVWYATNTGYVGQLFQDGTQLTSVSSIGALVTSSFYYDSNTDKLYIRTSTSGNPANYRIESGVDWDAYLLSLTYKASDYVDSRLRVRFPRIIPNSIGTVNQPNETYDYVIVRMTALITLYLLKTRDDFELAKKYKEDADKLIDDILDGKTKLSFELTSAGVGSGLITPKTTNTSTLLAFVDGTYTGITGIWYLKCTTIGAIGTAKYKLSTDNGATYPGEEITTSVEWVSLGYGIYVRWLNRNDESAGALVLNDLWKIEVYGQNEKVESAKLSSVRIQI